MVHVPPLVFGYLSNSHSKNIFAFGNFLLCFLCFSVWGPLNATHRLINGICLLWQPSRRLMGKTTLGHSRKTQNVIVYIMAPDVTIIKVLSGHR